MSVRSLPPPSAAVAASVSSTSATSASTSATSVAAAAAAAAAASGRSGTADSEFQATINAYHGGLYKRKDFVGREDAAKSHPNRTYYFRKDVDDEALAKACTRRIAEQPGDPKPFCIRGSILAKRGKYEAAVADFNQALQIVPRDAACLYGRGLAQEKCGRLGDAIQDFTTILEHVDPGNYTVAYARADCYNRLGDFEAAIRDYDFALSRDNTKTQRPLTPRFLNASKSSARNSSGEIPCQKRGSRSSALSDSAVRNSTSLTQPKSSRGSGESARVDGERSQSPATRSDSQTQEPRTARNSSNNSSRTTATPETSNTSPAADEAIRQPLRLPISIDVPSGARSASPSSDAEFSTSATASAAKSRGAEPSNARNVIETDALKRAEEHHQRGYALRKQGKFEEAVAEYTASLKLRPSSFKALFNRGFALDKLQRFPEAVRDYSQALHLDPQNASV
eukprot:INCI7045.4.p1 GENE.INCI7045.4~~INCI7045.4.p1  ORF type:complete len:453 (+),score=77.32 INCI7045.4:227-1585(+)